jgi:hypothetical protein
MNRPPQTPRQNVPVKQHAQARRENFHTRQAARQLSPVAAPPRATPAKTAHAAPTQAPTQSPPRASGRAVQPKIHGAAPRADAELSGACSPCGTIQANVIGGTRALHNRLVALHAAAHREAASRQRGVAQGRAVAAARAGGAQAVQCKSSFGVDAFRVSLQPKTGGQPLPSDVRAKMEAAFGSDFSDVRVHVGHEASRIGAIAYTWGANIHFAPGHYNPHTLQGQKVLGHELWHVVQQKSGRVQNPFGGGVAVVQDHALEAEADRMGVKAAMTSVVSKPGGE